MVGINEDLPNQSGERSQAVAPMAYIRATPLGAKISMALVTFLVTVAVTLFVQLLSAWTAAQNKLDANFRDYATKNQEQHDKFWDDISAMKSYLCARFHFSKKRCDM